MSRIDPRNTMTALHLVRIFEDSKKAIDVSGSTEFRSKKQLDSFKNSADISMNSENALIISI